MQLDSCALCALAPVSNKQLPKAVSFNSEDTTVCYVPPWLAEHSGISSRLEMQPLATFASAAPTVLSMLPHMLPALPALQLYTADPICNLQDWSPGWMFYHASGSMG